MNLFKKFIAFAMGNGIVFILSLISTPIITRVIDANNMGKFSMFTTITSLIILTVQMGLDQAYVRYYYDEDEKIRGLLLLKSLSIPLLICIPIIGGIFLAYKPVSNFIVGEESLFIIVLVAIHLFITIASNFIMLEVRMRQKAKLYSTLCVIMKVTYLGSVGLLFYIFKDNYITLVLATIIGNAIMTIAALIKERDVWTHRSKNIKTKTSNKQLIKYGIPFIFSMAILWIFQSIDKVSIKAFCGYSEVGLYAGAMNIVSILNTVQGAFTTFWTPVAFEKYSTAPEDTDFFVKINEIVSIVMLLGAIFIIAFKDIIIYFLGPTYREAVFILPFLVFMPVMSCISETTVIGINFKKKTHQHIIIAVISAVTNLVGNLILVPLLGAKGAAISTGFAYVVFFLSRTIISKKYYNVNYSLGKLISCTAVVYVLAIYASFYRFNLIIFILFLVSAGVVLFGYRNTISYIVSSLKKRKSKINVK